MLTLSIPAISCAHCVRAVTAAVQEVDPGATVEVDIAAKQARVVSRAATSALLDKLAAEGYPATAM